MLKLAPNVMTQEMDPYVVQLLIKEDQRQIKMKNKINKGSDDDEEDDDEDDDLI